MKFRVKLLLLEIISLVMLSASIVSVSLAILENEVSLRVEETLQVAVEGYTDNVNYLKNSGNDIEITVFEGDTRVESSISGVIGTKADSEVVKAVINNKQTYFVTNITVGGEKFFGYYKPIDGGMLFAGKPKAVVTSLLVKIAMITIGITVVLCVAFVLFTLYIANKMSNSLNKAKDQIVSTADLDLTFNQDEKLIQRTDEFGDMGRAVIKLHDSLKAIVSEILGQSESLNKVCDNFKQSFDTINNNVSQVNMAMEEVAQGGTVQAQETVAVGGQVAEMATVIDESISNIGSLKESITEMTNFSSDTKSVLADLSTASESTVESVLGVTTQINITNNSIENIKKAIEMIQDIASQTNLLSINASIEAAHAGESGKGFAVVADEIKKLSDSSAASAKEIEDMANEILANSKNSVDKMVVVNNDINKQKDKLNNTLKAFDTLQVEISAIETAIGNIAEQINHLDSQKETISRSSEQLAAISQENAASSQEVSASMQTLARVVSECNKEVSVLADASKSLEEQINKFQL
ncbi:MAG: hypothetical protein HDR05_12500 [Lachnospiraceae bacterium]|nr:hypothetical protein [Lachnospiraceae bacterium]